MNIWQIPLPFISRLTETRRLFPQMANTPLLQQLQLQQQQQQDCHALLKAKYCPQVDTVSCTKEHKKTMWRWPLTHDLEIK